MYFFRRYRIINENYNVFKFYNGQDAQNCIENEKLDLDKLDVMLTAKDEEIDKITNLPYSNRVFYTVGLDIKSGACGQLGSIVPHGMGVGCKIEE